MYFWGVLSLFFTNSSFGTSIPITNTICGGSNINMPSSLNEEPKLCHFGNTFLGDGVSDGSKSENAKKDFTTSIDEEVLWSGKDNNNINVLGKIAHFKKNRELFCQKNFLHELKEEQRLDGTIDSFCGMYSDSYLKDSRFIGLEKKGVFVGMGKTKGKELFLGRREGSRMFGFLRADQQGIDQQVFPLIGYFNMNDEGKVKNAGIVLSRSDENVGFSIKTGPGRNEHFVFYIPLPEKNNDNEINKVYKEIESNKNFKSLKCSDSVKKQVGSMFVDAQKESNLCKEFQVQFKNIPESVIMGIIEGSNNQKDMVCDGAFSFPIYLNGEEREGLLFFVKVSSTSFDICFGLQPLEKDMCVFVPLLVVYFSQYGESCLFFDCKDSSNSCEIKYLRGRYLFNCNFSLPDGRGIIIVGNSADDKVYIASPLKGNKIKHGEEQGHSLRGLIQSSELRFKFSEENTEFLLRLSSSLSEALCLKIPCLKNGPEFNFAFLPFGYTLSLKDHIKKGDKEFDTLSNFLVVSKNLVLLINNCANNRDILNVKILEDGNLKKEANFYYPQEVRKADSFCSFVEKIINGAVSVDGTELPFIVSLEAFKESNWNKKVDSETGNFLTGVFSDPNVEVNSINEDEKELNTDNDINKEKKGKEIVEVSIQKKDNNKTDSKCKANTRKCEWKKPKKKDLLNSIEPTKSKTSNKISNGLKQGENRGYKPGEEVTIEYFLEGKDGEEEKREIKYKIEDEEKEFFGEKRRIVILCNKKDLPSGFKYKGSVSEILKSGKKMFPGIRKLLTRALFNLSCAKILSSSIKMSKIRNVKISNRGVFEVYVAHNTQTEIGNQVRLLVAYDKAKTTFYAFDSLCHCDK